MSRGHLHHPWRLALLAAASVAVLQPALSRAASGPPPPEPWKAVRYIERPEGGRAVRTGRPLPTDGHAYYGIDVDSRVDIRIDTPALREEMKKLDEPDPRIASLTKRIQDLTSAVRGFADAQEKVQELFRAYEDASAAGATDKEQAPFRKLAADMATQLREILRAVHDARQERLVSEGLSPEKAKVLADQAFEPVLTGGAGQYDWERLRNLYDEEILLAERDLERLDPSRGIALEIQGYLVNGDGRHAIPLAKWNDVASGPRKPVRKVFAETSEAQQLDTATQGLTTESGRASAARTALATAVRRDNSTLREIKKVTSAGTGGPGGLNEVETGALKTTVDIVEEPPRPFPVPAGQRRLPLTGDLSDAFDLERVQDSRKKGDVVELRYAFYRGEEPVGSTWTDSFALESFGWHDASLGSLAFVRQKDSETWKPAATWSWVITHRKWPKATEGAASPADVGDSGLRNANRLTWFSGAGLSAMALDFEDDKDLELGLAPTLSFLNDHLLVGYGWNLQATDKRTYWFLSLRFFAGKGVIDRFDSKNKKKGGGDG